MRSERGLEAKQSGEETRSYGGRTPSAAFRKLSDLEEASQEKQRPEPAAVLTLTCADVLRTRCYLQEEKVKTVHGPVLQQADKSKLVHRKIGGGRAA